MGLFDRLGKADWKDGTWYNGGWKLDEYHGKGELESHIFHYKGEWKEGKRHGEGNCEWKAYEANASGLQEVTWTKGSSYKGGWHENLYSG